MINCLHLHWHLRRLHQLVLGLGAGLAVACAEVRSSPRSLDRVFATSCATAEGIRSVQAAATPTPTQHSASGAELPGGDWVEAKLPTLVIHYPVALSSEAERFAGYAEDFRAALRVHFSGFDSDGAMTRPGVCHLYLMPVQSEVAGPGFASSRTGATGDREPYCDIFIMPTSRFPPDRMCCTIAREPYDAEVDRRWFAHEYVGVLLSRLNDANGHWRFHSAPGWFVQGLEEYLALTLTTAHSLGFTLKAYLAIVAADPLRIGFFSVSNDYVDGAVLQEFLHEEFGAAKVISVIVSKERSFASAMQKELGVTPGELISRWTRWQKRKLKPVSP